MSGTQFVAAGSRLRYEVVGEGEPVLFTGNTAVPAARMRALAPLLPGCRLILVDHLGPADTTVEAIAEHCGTLLDHLDADAWVWGYSQGACVAQELALARPDRVRGAVLTATRGRLSRFLEHYLRACEELHGVPDSVVACFTLLAEAPAELLGVDDHAEFALHQALTVHRDVDLERDRRSLRVSAAYGDRLAELRGVRVPCLAVSFGADLICPPALGREVATAIPSCEYAEIPGAGHGGLVTHAVEVLDAVTGFIERHRAGARRSSCA